MTNDYFIVEGGNKLYGDIYPSGNKNEALPAIAAALLTDEEVILENIPDIKDTRVMLSLADSLGCEVEKIDDHTYSLKAKELSPEKIINDSAARIRSSLLFIAPLLLRCKKTPIPNSGGDRIGRRRIDTHLLVLQKLGAEFLVEQNYYFKAESLTGAYVLLDEASVMATENALMAAVLAKGETILYNVACEPHIQGLCNMLVSMGAKIEGIGTNRLRIEGVKSLTGCKHKIMPDHIEIGSFIGLAAATRSSIRIKDCYNPHLEIIFPAFRKLGIKINIEGNDICIYGNPNLVIQEDFGGKIPTIYDQPWPSFPADLTSIMVVTALFAKGTIMIHEKMFEGRLFFTDSLIRMGGKLVLCDPHRVVVNGPSTLKAIELSSPDIRAGMAMLIAALAAEGESIIHNVKQIDRGYEKIDERLNKIGAKINRVIQD